VTALVVLAFLAPRAFAATRYVSPTGNDNNPGTKEQPFASVQIGINASGSSDTLVLASGTYTGQSNLTFTAGGVSRQNLAITSETGNPADCVIDFGHYGGFAMDARQTMNGITFLNAGNQLGGAVRALGNSDPTITNCVFNYNAAITRGGGIGAEANGSFTVVNCVFVENPANEGGAIATNAGSHAVITGCVFNRNSAAARGGGVFVDSRSAAVSITNCSFMANSGGGLRADGAVTLKNSILWYDYDGEVEGGAVTMSYCTVQGLPEARDANNNFGLPPGYTSPFDLSLEAGSPCIDAGEPNTSGLPAQDAAGFARVQGAAVDIGAYEFGGASADVAAYVDRAAGSDATGTGAAAAPFQTVAKALSVSRPPNARLVIHVKAGDYVSDKPHISGRVRIVNWGNIGRARIGAPPPQSLPSTEAVNEGVSKDDAE
jgi:hypothetical protein